MFIKRAHTISAVLLSGLLTFSFPISAISQVATMPAQKMIVNKQNIKAMPHYLEKLQKQNQNKRLMYKGDNYFEILLEQIKDNTISSVILDREFTSEQVLILLDALHNNTSVEYLECDAGIYSSVGKIDPEIVSSLAALLSRNTTITGFSFSNPFEEILEVDLPSLDLILKSIQAGQSIESFNFLGWAFTPETAQVLTEFVANQPSLESIILGLDNGKGGVCESTCLVNALPLFQAIQDSSIRGFIVWSNIQVSMPQNPMIAKALSETVLQKSDLKLFGLYGFTIDSDTASQFSNAFLKIDSLYSLYLFHNELDDVAFSNMLPGLSKMTTLHNLEVILQNFSSNKTAEGLLNLYSNNPLESLTFWNIFPSSFVLDAEHLESFADKLKDDTNLEELILELGIEDMGAYLLAPALAQNSTVEMVDLMDNHFTTEGVRVLMSVLEDNYTLLSYGLNFWGMDLRENEINLFYDRLQRNWEMRVEPRE